MLTVQLQSGALRSSCEVVGRLAVSAIGMAGQSSGILPNARNLQVPSKEAQASKADIAPPPQMCGGLDQHGGQKNSTVL
jgi:hypothetical protein